MEENDVILFQNWFEHYVETFRSPDPYTDRNNRLKKDHSLRVRDHCIAIARSLHLPEEQRLLAETIGLFHDIGRFEQFRKYRTFSDKRSENHAELGAAVMKQENILSRLAPGEQDVILKGIQFHNARDIPADRDPDTRFFLKIVRDADKLDILELLAEFYNSADTGNNPALALDLPDTPGISEAVLDDLRAQRCVDLKNCRSVNDFKCLQSSWVFDLNFPYSLEHVKTGGQIRRIMQTLPQTPEIRHIHRRIEQFFNSSPGPSGIN
jgi:putative nucleotidyltransferase with HDIG domain